MTEQAKIIDQFESDVFEGRETPTGAWSTGWVKMVEPVGSVLWNGVRRLLAREAGVRDYALDGFREPKEPLHLTVHHAWSGYSEYTITNEWDEITVEWGTYSRHFPHMTHFFRAVFEADLSYDRDARWDMKNDARYGTVATELDTPQTRLS